MIKSLINYASFLILSTGTKNFSAIGREFNKSGQTISRMLDSKEDLSAFLHAKINSFFSKNEKVTLVIDDTLINKQYAHTIAGTGFFFDTSLRSEQRAYKILVCVLTNGKITLPIEYEFVADARLIDPSDAGNEKEKIKQNRQINKEKKHEFITKIILHVLKNISKERLTITVDGWFISVELLTWAMLNNVKIEGRARSNAVVMYKNSSIALRDIKNILPKGRQMCRTVKVFWHNLPLFVTIEKRIDRHGDVTFVYQFATYKAKKPIDHVNQYKKRWVIEQFFRTCKQSLGLKECQSTNFDIQERHILSVFCAFAIAQEWAILKKCSNIESAIRSIQAHKQELLTLSINRSNRIFNQILS
jgi:hypothetical protein